MGTEHSESAGLDPTPLRTALRRLLDAKKDGYALVAVFLEHSTVESLPAYAKAFEEILRSDNVSPDARYGAFAALYNIRERGRGELTDVIQRLLTETCEKLIARLCERFNRQQLESSLSEPRALIELHVAHGGKATDALMLEALVPQIENGSKIVMPIMRIAAAFGAFGPPPAAPDDVEHWLSEIRLRGYRLAARRAEAKGKFGVAGALRTRCGETGGEISHLYKMAAAHRQAVDLTHGFDEWMSGQPRASLDDALEKVFGTRDLQGHALLSRERGTSIQPEHAYSEGVVRVKNPLAERIVTDLLAHGRWADANNLLLRPEVRADWFNFITVIDLVIPAFFEAMNRGRIAVAAALGQVIRKHNQILPFSPRSFPYSSLGDKLMGRPIHECAKALFRDRETSLNEWERKVCKFADREYNLMDGSNSTWVNERVGPRPADLEEAFVTFERERRDWMNSLATSILAKADALMDEVIQQGLALELHLD